MAAATSRLRRRRGSANRRPPGGHRFARGSVSMICDERVGSVPDGDVAAVGEHDVVDALGYPHGALDQAVMVGPDERDRTADPLQALEAAGAHRVVDPGEARRRRVGANEMGGLALPGPGADGRRRHGAAASARPTWRRAVRSRVAAARPTRWAMPCLGTSGSGHSPAGAIAVTRSAAPLSPSSSPTQPPSELPTTWGG